MNPVDHTRLRDAIRLLAEKGFKTHADAVWDLLDAHLAITRPPVLSWETANDAPADNNLPDTLCRDEHMLNDRNGTVVRCTNIPPHTGQPHTDGTRAWPENPEQPTCVLCNGKGHIIDASGESHPCTICDNCDNCDARPAGIPCTTHGGPPAGTITFATPDPFRGWRQSLLGRRHDR